MIKVRFFQCYLINTNQIIQTPGRLNKTFWFTTVFQTGLIQLLLFCVSNCRNMNTNPIVVVVVDVMARIKYKRKKWRDIC